MSEFLPADIVNFQSNALLSKLIRIVTTGSLPGSKKYKEADNHSAMILYVQDGYKKDVLIGEFVFRGYSTRWLQKVLKKAKKKKWRLTFYRIKSQYLKKNPDKTRANIVKNFATLKGRGYDFPLLFGLLLRSFLRLLGPKLYNRSKRVRIFLDSKTKFDCSEGIATAIKKGTGHILKKKHHLSQITPRDIGTSYMLKQIARYEDGKWQTENRSWQLFMMAILTTD